MLYTTFTLKCFEELKDATAQFLSQFDGNDIYFKHLPISDYLRNKINQEMAEYELPNLLNFLTFKRRNFFVDDVPDPLKMRAVHVDFHPAKQTITKASIILPISGCEGTHMYYVGGKYDMDHVRTPENVNYCTINWLDTPYIIDKVNIVDKPVLSKLDIPHDADSNRDGTYRCTLTMRFEGNPSFDEIYEKLNRHGCIA